MPDRKISTDGRIVIGIDEAIAFFASRPKVPEHNPQIDGKLFRVDLQIPPHIDPMSAEYRSLVLGHYQKFSGHPYKTDFEGHAFEETSDIASRPWPYSTGNADLIGEQLQASGFILRKVKPKPNDKVLELGAGWGNMTLPLALLGCKVTATDIEERYLRILRRRSELAEVSFDVVRKPFLDIGQLGGDFDLVITCAAFHHCDDPVRLLRTIRSMLKSGGKVALCGEPMDESLACPWGLNSDGAALSFVHAFGWLELVFRVSYLRSALTESGFAPELHVCAETALGNVFLGTAV